MYFSKRKLLFLLVYVSCLPLESDFFAEHYSCRYLSFSSFDSFVFRKAGFICMKLFRGYSCRYLSFSSFDSFVFRKAGFICMKLFRGTPRIFEYC